MKVISTKNAPAALGPYSQAVEVNDLLFVSGQLGIDPATGKLVAESFQKEAAQVLKNLDAISRAAGVTHSEYAKLTVYLVDLSDFAELNAIMENHFKAPFPARACVEVSALPKGASIEIEAVVSLGK